MTVAFSGNDNLASRFVLPTNDTQATGSTVGYGEETGEPTHSDYYGSTAWFSLTPASTGSCTISTVGSDFDTAMAVYTSSDPAAPAYANLTEIAYDDDSGGNSTSLVTINVTAGTEYFIQVGGYGWQTGNLTVNYASPTPPPSTVHITDPGPQNSRTVIPALPLQIEATNDAANPLTYSLTGGPPDTTIDPATGVINSLARALGSFLTTVTATDTVSGDSASADFNWLSENYICSAKVGGPPLTGILVFQNNFNVDAFAIEALGGVENAVLVAYTLSGTNVQAHVQILDCTGASPTIVAEQGPVTVATVANANEVDAGQGFDYYGRGGVSSFTVLDTTNHGTAFLLPIVYSGGVLTIGAAFQIRSYTERVGPPSINFTVSGGSVVSAISRTGHVDIDCIAVDNTGKVLGPSSWAQTMTLPTNSFAQQADLCQLDSGLFLVAHPQGYFTVQDNGTLSAFTANPGLGDYSGTGSFPRLAADPQCIAALWSYTHWAWFDNQANAVVDTTTPAVAGAPLPRELYNGAWIEGTGLGTGQSRTRLLITQRGKHVSGSPMPLTDDINSDGYTVDRCVKVGSKYLVICNQGSPWDYSYAYLIEMQQWQGSVQAASGYSLQPGTSQNPPITALVGRGWNPIH